MNEAVVEILQTIVAAIAPIIAAGLVALIAKYFQKLGIEVDAAKQDKLRIIAIKAVLGAEEWAAARIKAGVFTTSGQKLAQAVEQIQTQAPKVAVKEAADLIQQTLPALGLGAVSFLDQQKQQTPPLLPQTKEIQFPPAESLNQS
jgi:hypothetical protein